MIIGSIKAKGVVWHRWRAGGCWLEASREAAEVFSLQRSNTAQDRLHHAICLAEGQKSTKNDLASSFQRYHPKNLGKWAAKRPEEQGEVAGQGRRLNTATRGLHRSIAFAEAEGQKSLDNDLSSSFQQYHPPNFEKRAERRPEEEEGVAGQWRRPYIATRGLHHSTILTEAESQNGTDSNLSSPL